MIDPLPPRRSLFAVWRWPKWAIATVFAVVLILWMIVQALFDQYGGPDGLMDAMNRR